MLDIDGTIDTADKKQLRRIVSYTNNKKGVKRHINTARSQAYCDKPDGLTWPGIATKAKHHCLVPQKDPPRSKVINMEKIMKMEKIKEKKCVVLIDDRPENIQAVRKAGFSAIKVHEGTGIQKETVDKAHRIINGCLANHSKMRGVSTMHGDNCGHTRRLLLRLAILAAIVLLLVLFCRV